MVGTSSNLTLGVSNDHVGSYTCRASVMGVFIEAEASIYLKGPPSITSTKKQFGIPGETVQIECVAFSIPKPRHIVWSYNGREINSSQDGDYTVLEESTTFGMKSMLVIRDSDTKHFGRYNCSVANAYGHDNVDIVLSGLGEFGNFFDPFSFCVTFETFPNGTVSRMTFPFASFFVPRISLSISFRNLSRRLPSHLCFHCSGNHSVYCYGGNDFGDLHQKRQEKIAPG